jgi:threonine/homoserine/homoserine lactone efflux protein
VWTTIIPGHSSLLLFVTGGIVLLVIPGPAVLYIVGRSIDQGRRAGIVSALGIASGALVHVTAAALGLSALLVSSAAAFSTLKYLGAGYLIYLGALKLLRDEPFGTAHAPEPRSHRRLFRQGLIVSVLNPKEALFFFAFLPQFVDPTRGQITAQILFLGLLFVAMGVVSDSLWALFAGTLARRLKRNTRWMRAQRYMSGGMLISLGVATALAGSGSKK